MRRISVTILLIYWENNEIGEQVCTRKLQMKSFRESG